MEAKAYRRCFTTGNKEILQVEGEVPWAWCLWLQRTWSETAALWLPPLPRQRTPRPKPRVTWIQKVGETQTTHTNTASNTPRAAAANANWEGTRERERFYLQLGQTEIGHGQS